MCGYVRFVHHFPAAFWLSTLRTLIRVCLCSCSMWFVALHARTSVLLCFFYCFRRHPETSRSQFCAKIVFSARMVRHEAASDAAAILYVSGDFFVGELRHQLRRSALSSGHDHLGPSLAQAT